MKKLLFGDLLCLYCLRVNSEKASVWWSVVSALLEGQE